MSQQKKPIVQADPDPIDEVATALEKTAELAALQVKFHYLSARRKDAYARLGKLTYQLHCPRKDTNPEQIDDEMETTVEQITALSHRITDLAIRIKLLKLDMVN